MTSARITTLAAAILFVAAAAGAQPAGPASSGPMTIEQIHSGVLFAADARLTKVDGHSATLVGGDINWVVDDTFGIGGGGYWLANNARDRRMAYGGLTFRWLGHAGDRFGYGFKALIGGGEATLGETVTEFAAVRNPITGRFPTEPRVVTVLVRRDFFVAEPEANASFTVVPHVRVAGGVGYRLIGDTRSDDRLRGATGTIGVQIF